jgi:DNA polymerase III epsilon subunit-like protein
MNIAFLDIETTGLNPLKHEILEVGIVLRDQDPGKADEEIHFSLPIDLTKADERALEINGFTKRRAALQEIQAAPSEALQVLVQTLSDALVVGNNVQFDLRFIEQFLGEAPWYYSPLDLKAYAAGKCGLPQPASTKFVVELAATKVGKYAHTALADARWNVRVYDALVKR